VKVKSIDSLSSSSDAKGTPVDVSCESLSVVQTSEVLGSWGCLLLKKRYYRDLHRHIKQICDKFACLP